MPDSFGERIKAARLAKGMTQEELAEALGTQYVQVGRWERNVTSPRPKTIRAIAQTLGVTFEQLQGGAVLGITSPTSTEVNRLLADQVARFVSGYQDLVGNLDPGVEAALTVLLYRECERQGVADPKDLPKAALHALISKAVG